MGEEWAREPAIRSRRKDRGGRAALESKRSASRNESRFARAFEIFGLLRAALLYSEKLSGAAE